MSESMINLLTIIGAVVGILLGIFVGRFRIYYSLNKSNSIGNGRNPELDKEKDISSGNRAMILVVGLIFLILGIGIIVMSLGTFGAASEIADETARYVDLQNQGMLIVFGGVCVFMGGLVTFASIKGER